LCWASSSRCCAASETNGRGGDGGRVASTRESRPQIVSAGRTAPTPLRAPILSAVTASRRARAGLWQGSGTRGSGATPRSVVQGSWRRRWMTWRPKLAGLIVIEPAVRQRIEQQPSVSFLRSVRLRRKALMCSFSRRARRVGEFGRERGEIVGRHGEGSCGQAFKAPVTWHGFANTKSSGLVHGRTTRPPAYPCGPRAQAREV
jgi:hypothetical protein